MTANSPIPLTHHLSMVRIITLFICTFHGFHSEIFQIVIAISIASIVIRNELLNQPIIWFAISFSAVSYFISGWEQIDNHKYILLYWILSIFFSTLCTDEEISNRYLGRTSEFLLFFIFFGAVVQKLISVDYLNGSFFAYSLLLDDRFSFLDFMFELDKVMFEEFISNLHSPLRKSNEQIFVLNFSSNLMVFAFIITYFNLVIQLIIEVFSLSGRPQILYFFNISLILFILLVYFAAPVIGFGQILCLLAIQKNYYRGSKKISVYIYLIPLLEIYSLPWRYLLP